ncbi:envelope stress response membrane protein PspC [Dokdonella sp.]|uniref:envelope stress response membrane protein PspC n=1 Tax=Dokdonella sp. TaxID=2291710 RepID=UPI0025BF189F|nr:envelope stress response membrane protein PspC [Dokdonella sp.]MBX3690253.1 envelope stress response membrane protein PspC [Dokdonella sp.]
MRRREPWRAQRFYRDPANGKVMGVCAGIADYFGWNVTWVRVIAIVALLWLNVVTLIAYVALGMLWPVKPERPYDWDTGEEYWQSVRRSATGTFREVRQRFRELDQRLQRLEGYVTSRHHDLDRKFRELES